jgi:vibriolysin
LQLVKKVSLSNGKIKARFEQQFNGVPVWNNPVTADHIKGRYTHWQGYYLTHLSNDIKSVHPILSKEKVLELLKTKFKAKDSYNEKATMYVLAGKHQKATLSYLVSFVIPGKTPQRPHALINANTGKILRQWEGLTTNKQANGPGGNQKTGRYVYGQDFQSMMVSTDCRMITDNVQTINLNHQTSGGQIFQFNNCGSTPYNDYKQINGAYSPINDAHFFGNVVFNLYSDWYQSAPLRFNLTMRVHYSQNYENAFWDGRQMTFGDGASYFYPLVSLDVVSHEVSHGFTEQNSGLVYENQSGGINEAFSDMAGEAAKYYNNSGQNNWLVGEQILKGPAGSAMRYFEDPTRDGRSIGHASDYYPGIDVHFSSGVFNRAFFLIANTSNWNTRKAFDTMVLANEMYWSEDATFESAACGVKRATSDLGYDTSAIVEAFDTVGVDATCGDEPNPPNPPTPPKGEELQNKLPIIVSGARDSEKFFYLDVPKDTRYLRFETSGGSGDVDLFIKLGDKPSKERFDCRSFTDGNEEVCDFFEPIAGRYYVMLNGYTSYLNVTLMPIFYTKTLPK